MIADENNEEIEQLLELYSDAQTICTGTPDQYQYRHNLLLRSLAKYILKEYLESEDFEEMQ